MPNSLSSIMISAKLVLCNDEYNDYSAETSICFCLKYTDCAYRYYRSFAKKL